SPKAPLAGLRARIAQPLRDDPAAAIVAALGAAWMLSRMQGTLQVGMVLAILANVHGFSLKDLSERGAGPYQRAVLNRFFDSPHYSAAIARKAFNNSLFSYQKFLEEIYRRVDLRGKAVLELGCGPGVIVEILNRLGGVHAVGLERQRAFVDFAQQNK